MLEKQVADLQQTVKSVGSERDQANQQYQQYVQQLNVQLQSLASKVPTYMLIGIIIYLVLVEALCMILKTLNICNKMCLIYQVESLSCENEQLVAREQSLVQHVSELEKQLQHLQQQNQKRRDSSPKSLQQDSVLLRELEAKLELTESKNQTLAEKLDSQVLTDIMSFHLRITNKLLEQNPP